MGKDLTVKIGPEIDKKLYTKLTKVAEENGQSVRFVLERAMENYIRLVAPSQSDIRPEAIVQFRRSVAKNRKLLQLLAKG